jgi:hypothetical protein
MYIVPPVDITDAMIIASSLTENDTDDAPLWNSATAYTVGQRVRRTQTHRVYECAVANTNKVPESNISGTTPAWFEVRATNMWAAFDAVSATQSTSASGTISYTLAPGEIVDRVVLFNMDAVTVSLTQKDSGGNVVFSQTVDLRTKYSKGWYDYFFKPIIRKRDYVFEGLPPYKNSTFILTFTKSGGTVAVGDIVLGREIEVGELLWQPEVRIQDYSGKTTNTFGVTTFIKRDNARIMTCQVQIENDYFDELVRLMALYTSVPVVWIGDADYSSTMIYGTFTDFRPVLDSPAGSFVNLQIEGLI